ncbi:MAG: type II toxin-antitoxin system RelE/ParE family toxin [Chloroflexia bacterium]|nr:type II toxin-antitoxin system RelE/ParE family toxin [Chloroflexia bacterium]
MSAHSVDVQLARSAHRDIDDILLYTRRTWGNHQRANHRAAIYQALDMLSRYPEAGRARDDRFPGCRSIQVEQPIIYFHQPQAGEIEVLRILHHRQDASAAVPEPPS